MGTGRKDSKTQKCGFHKAAPWRRQWHPTPVLLPGKSHGWWSLACCDSWGHKESDTTERLNWTELIVIQSIYSQWKLWKDTTCTKNFYLCALCMKRCFQAGFTILIIQTNLAYASTASFQLDPVCVCVCVCVRERERIGWGDFWKFFFGIFRNRVIGMCDVI